MNILMGTPQGLEWLVPLVFLGVTVLLPLWVAWWFIRLAVRRELNDWARQNFPPRR